MRWERKVVKLMLIFMKAPIKSIVEKSFKTYFLYLLWFYYGFQILKIVQAENILIFAFYNSRFPHHAFGPALVIGWP